MQVAALTVKAQGILRTLYTDAGLSPAKFTQGEAKVSPPAKWGLRAIWDTGASGSAVSIQVADGLGFKPIGYTPVSTANGDFVAPVYICDIYLPSGVVVPSVEMTGGKLGSDADMLIGMDVIALGDFTITNLGGVTWFTFRVPSMQRADYSVMPKPNGDDRCPCGTTKKYKNCCKPIAQKHLAAAFK